MSPRSDKKRKKKATPAERGLAYRFALSDDEYARAWLREYYRRPGWRVWRVVGGPCFILLGLGLTRSEELVSRIVGGAAIVMGLWYALKPLLGARMLRDRRAKSGRAKVELEVRVGPSGIRIDDGTVKQEIAWPDVVRAGASKEYVWYELRGGSRATIPLRVVEDPIALRELLRAHTRWEE
ncbi:MAG: hypothetical protein KF729_32590 [Sandaracinaceae bacterium]|nr:hypothetical protein [Sandaracinaceae bacterium]